MVSQTELLPTTRTNNEKMNMDLNSSFGFNNGKAVDSRHKKRSSLLLAAQPGARTVNIVGGTAKAAQGTVLQEPPNDGSGPASRLGRDGVDGQR